MELDYKKIINYATKFNQWKQELFIKEEYAHKNGCCFAFAHLLGAKAKEDGMMPLKVWCLPQRGKKLEVDFTTGDGQNTASRTWEGYHVALAVDLPIYQHSSKTERIVFDPILFNAPVLEKDWKKIMYSGHEYFNCSGCKFGADAKQDTSVYGGSGYWLDKDPIIDLDQHARLFIKKIDCDDIKFNPRNSTLLMEAMKLRRNAQKCVVTADRGNSY